MKTRSSLVIKEARWGLPGLLVSVSLENGMFAIKASRYEEHKIELKERDIMILPDNLWDRLCDESTYQ